MASRLVWGAAGAISESVETPTTWNPRREFRGNSVVSDAGVVRSSGLDHFDALDLMWDYLVGDDTRNQFLAWWSWAKQRKSFGFALDENKMGNTTSNGDVAAGATSITLTSATAFAIGDIITIRDADGVVEEQARITNKVGSTLTITALRYAHASGSTVRHWGYFPALYCTSVENPVRDAGGLGFGVSFSAREYRSA